MNWLDMLDPQKKRAMELAMEQQAQSLMVPQMLQTQMPQGMGMLQPMPMPMQQGQAGYGVLAPEANTPANIAGAEGAQTFGQTMTGAAPGLLAAAAALAGGNKGGDNVPIMPAPSPSRPVGTSKDGLPALSRQFRPVERKRRKTA
jgi:hypothetical protein